MTAPLWFVPPDSCGAHFSGLIKAADAPKAVDERDFATRLFRDHLVAEIDNPALNAALVVLQNHQGQPLTIENFDAVAEAVEAFADVISIEVGNVVTVADDHPAVELVASKKDRHGKHRQAVLGRCICATGDLTIARANAATITELLPAARLQVAEAGQRLQITREIQGEKIILDANQARWFDARHWQAGPYLPDIRLDSPAMWIDQSRHEIFERKTGHRLADLIAGVDGVWVRAHPANSVPTDYRAHKLVVVGRSVPQPVEMPPEVFAAITAAATKANLPVAQFIAQRCGQ